jgi:TonB family protein
MSYLGPSLRRNPFKDRSGWRIAVAIAVSVVVNLLWFWGFGGAFRPGEARPVRNVALAPLSASQWAANRSITGEAPAPTTPPLAAAPAAPPKPPPPEPEKPKGQIVDVAPSQDNRAPDSSRYLSDRNNRVEKETRSKYAGSQVFKNTLPAPSAGGKPAPPTPPPGEGGKSAQAIPGKEGAKAAQGTTGTPPQAPSQRHQDKVALAPTRPGEGIAPREDRQQQGQNQPPAAPGTPGGAPEATGTEGGEGGERRSGELASRFLPTAKTYERLAGGPAPDKLDGVEEGEGTFLNTREFKYATYMNRIKQSVAQEWDWLSPLKDRDPQGNLFGYKEWQTWLVVTLDDSGAVKKLDVAQPSGLVFLDQAAMDAFRKAQPFLNPPRGMVDGHGEIKFAFGFSLDLTRSAGFQIHRIPSQY